MDLNKSIIYMDDPLILDNLNRSNLLIFDSVYGHRHDLQQKISTGRTEKEFTLVDEIVADKKLEKILNILDGVCGGKLSADKEKFVYTADNLNGNLDMVNLSTGMKSFVILSRLLKNGSIDENGMIILDEPEIHLHPEWQLKFAECIVLIQKEFGANILLNTHSPYFLNAIEVYAKKYDIKNKCKYYLMEEKDSQAVVKDVTENMEAIYAKLAEPLQVLENLEYGNGNTV